MSENEIDGLGALANVLAIKRSGWHRVENPENGAVGLFPLTATDESDWAQRALAQAQEAERMERETRPAPKPLVNAYAERLRRGD